MIKPTKGRIVLVTIAENGQFPGIITKARSDSVIDVVVFNGECAKMPCVGLAGVILVQDGEPIPEGVAYAEWLPFQVGQAALTAKIAEKAGWVDQTQGCPASDPRTATEVPVVAPVSAVDGSPL